MLIVLHQQNGLDLILCALIISKLLPLLLCHGTDLWVTQEVPHLQDGLHLALHAFTNLHRAAAAK